MTGLADLPALRMVSRVSLLLFFLVDKAMRINNFTSSRVAATTCSPLAVSLIGSSVFDSSAGASLQTALCLQAGMGRADSYHHPPL